MPAEVIGVMPASFAFPDPRVDIWIAEPMTRSMGFGIWLYNGVARLRDGVTLADARTELNTLIADVPRAFPGDPFVVGNSEEIKLFSNPRTLKDATVGSVARGLWILLASVGLVLLVACANVANLFLIRSDARQRGSPSVARSELAASASHAISSRRARCSRLRAARLGLRWRGAPCACSSPTVPRRSRGSARSGWMASPSPIRAD